MSCPGGVWCGAFSPALRARFAAARYAKIIASNGAASSNPQNPMNKLSTIGTISDAQIGTFAVRRMMTGCKINPSTTTIAP